MIINILSKMISFISFATWKLDKLSSIIDNYRSKQFQKEELSKLAKEDNPQQEKVQNNGK